MWRKINPAGIVGDFVRGDGSVPPTTSGWWHTRWLKWFVWKTAAAYRVVGSEVAGRGYRVGYIAHDGGHLLSKVLYLDRFCLLVGREDCRFFALNREGKEITLSREHLCDRKTAVKAYGYTLL